MVDFNNEVTVSTPASDVVRILVLQRRSDLFEALERYNKMDFQGIAQDNSVVKARLITLFLELQGGLKRRLKPEIYEDLKNNIFDNDKDKIIKAVYYLNEYLDEIRLTRLDNRPNVDSIKWEEVNKAYGY